MDCKLTRKKCVLCKKLTAEKCDNCHREYCKRCTQNQKLKSLSGRCIGKCKYCINQLLSYKTKPNIVCSACGMVGSHTAGKSFQTCACYRVYCKDKCEQKFMLTTYYGDELDLCTRCAKFGKI